jgi:hypothetical protein
MLCFTVIQHAFSELSDLSSSQMVVNEGKFGRTEAYD